MKQLLYKEWRLALHPATAAFWALSAMVLIPGYPYGVIFFYAALGLFFVCLTGRENRDLHYTLTLPVCKGDLVRARIWFAVQAELIQLALTIPFMALRNALHILPNPVGMDANIALVAVGFVLCTGVSHSACRAAVMLLLVYSLSLKPFGARLMNIMFRV